ncbi:MAG: gluconate 2-dehydrogenase subunit 3 family protein, partial [Bacteroidetes bacterium]|nr:gluconate 2-dehydrogenase subunit 3 family protein [Bacteroidota bacterium]
QQMQIVDLIAWPDRAKGKPELAQGVAFFNRMRNLTATGFYTTQMGYKDIGYMGNQPNQWNGVPDDVLKQYGLAYTEKEMNECVRFDKA